MGSFHKFIKLAVVLVINVCHNLGTDDRNLLNGTETVYELNHRATTVSKESETLEIFRDNPHVSPSGSGNTSSDRQKFSHPAKAERTEAAQGVSQDREGDQDIVNNPQRNYSGKSTDHPTKNTVAEFDVHSPVSIANETRPTVDFAEKQNGTQKTIPGLSDHRNRTENMLGPSKHHNGTENLVSPPKHWNETPNKLDPSKHRNGTGNTSSPSGHQQKEIDANPLAGTVTEQTSVKETTSVESAPDNYIELTSETVTECINSEEDKHSLTLFGSSGSVSFETPAYLDGGYKLNGSASFLRCRIHIDLPRGTVMQLHVSTIQSDCKQLRVYVDAGDRPWEFVNLCKEQKELSDFITPTNEVQFLIVVSSRLLEPVSVLLNFTAIPLPEKPQLELTYTSAMKGAR